MVSETWSADEESGEFEEEWRLEGAGEEEVALKPRCVEYCRENEPDNGGHAKRILIANVNSQPLAF